MSDDESRAGTYIAGKWHPYADPSAPQRRPTAEQELTAALEKHRDESDDWPLHDYIDNDDDDDDRPRYANLEDAHDAMLERAREAEAEADAEAERTRRHEAEAEEYEIHRTANEWAADDQVVLQHVGQRVQAFQQDAQVFTAAYQQAQAMQARGEQVPFEVQNKLREEAARLQAERAELQQAAAKVQHASALKALAAEQRKLYRDIPALKDKNTREAFIGWAESKGIPRDMLLSNQDRKGVGIAWKAYQQERRHEREAHARRPREPLFRTGPLARGGAVDGPMTADDARARLKRTGSEADALNYLTLRREQEADLAKR